MRRKFITNVQPMENYILHVEFVSGSYVLLDMKPQLDSVRFYPLKNPKVWKSATTNGIFVRFGDVELAHDEILAMLETPYPEKNGDFDNIDLLTQTRFCKLKGERL